MSEPAGQATEPTTTVPAWAIDRDPGSGTVHVWPPGDLIGHDRDTLDGCVCGPVVNFRPLGRVVVGHHSLDGREMAEPRRRR